MNKTVTVNIGGIVFHIDENAYERFRTYLEAIRSHFTTEEGRDEIMQDIESRIAEMFQERLKDIKQVITLEDVEQVTRQMGRPDQFVEEEERPAANVPLTANGKVKRKLFRDPDEKLLGGVCSGIANYFDIDRVWVRLAFAFIFFVFGTGFLLYILLWIIIPEASTTAEKLQMRGEPVTISTIEKNVREEMGQVKSNLSQTGKKAGTVVGRIFEAIGEVFKFLFLFIGKLIAVFFLFIGIVVSFALIMSVFALIGIPGTQYPEIWRHVFDSGTQFSLGFIGVLLLVGIPFLMLAYAGARMLFNIRKGSRVIGFTALGLWLIGLGLTLFIGMDVAGEFRQKESVRNEITLIQPASRKLHVEFAPSKNVEKDYDNTNYSNNWEDDWDLIRKGDDYVSRNIKVDFVKSPNDSFQLVQIFYARGASGKLAIEAANTINYGYTQQDSLLQLDRYFRLGPDGKYRSQKVQLLVRVPLGAQVYMDRSLRRYIYDIDNVENVLDNYMLDRTWVMTAKGLSCVDCDGSEKKLRSADDHRINISTDDGAEVRIDESGVHITGPDGERLAIDSTGIYIKNKKGEQKFKVEKELEVPAPPAPRRPEIRQLVY